MIEKDRFPCSRYYSPVDTITPAQLREYARAYFEAYNDHAGGKTWDGKPIPSFDDCGDAVRGHHFAGARALLAKLGVNVETKVDAAGQPLG